MNPFEGYRIASPYGPRIHPITKKQHFHTGIDLVKAHRAPIHAFVPGKVLHAGEGRIGSGFGNMGLVVAILDKYGSLHCYVHLDSVSVSVGEWVQRGQEVGKQGNTGKNTTGSHLHYEIRKKSSPSFGWVINEKTRCHEPAQYLIEYFEKEGDQPMTDEERKRLKELQNDVARIKSTLEAATRLIPAPDWFVREFGSADLDGLILSPQLTAEGWRILAIALRAQGKGIGSRSLK